MYLDAQPAEGLDVDYADEPGADDRGADFGDRSCGSAPGHPI
jgi:hypothetical protein